METVWLIAGGLVILVLSYVAGSIPWGFLIGKFNGLDIRRHGSGNIGATNVRRVLGRDWGMLCFALDFLKGLLPVLLLGTRLGAAMEVPPEYGRLLAAAGAVSGHVWPFWLRFRGGKGVATSIGALLAVSWPGVLISAASWVGVFYLTGYVSLASVFAAVMLPVGCVIGAVLTGEPAMTPTFVLFLAMGGLILLRHRTNIKRLRDGTEHRFTDRFSFGKKA